MVYICIWLQVTQNPYSSKVPAKETSSHMRRRRQTGPDPVRSSSPFIQTRGLSSISSNMLFPFGFPGVSTVLTEKALVATRLNWFQPLVIGIRIPITYNKGIRENTEDPSPLKAHQ